MKFKELKQQSEEELTKLLRDTREQLRNLRFRVAMDEHKDVRDVRDARKLVAKILTLLRERQHNG